MSTRGLTRARPAAAAGLATLGLLLVACGNDKPAAGDQTPVTLTSTTPSTGTPGPSTPTSGTPTAEPTQMPTARPTPSKPTPGATTKPTPTAAPTTKPVRLFPSMLLTGQELAKADPKRDWAVANGIPSTPICGRNSIRGDGVKGALSRNFANGLDASGGQWLTRYADAEAARAAYERIVKTIKSCKAARPAPTHARKLTENRTIAVGDATAILRWYDYPLPNDPGSEDGGFPYGVTLKGTVVSVVAFGEMGKGIQPANFERITRSAAAHLG